MKFQNFTSTMFNKILAHLACSAANKSGDIFIYLLHAVMLSQEKWIEWIFSYVCVQYCLMDLQ